MKMKLFLAMCTAAMLGATGLQAAAPASYQVTGKVLEVTDTTIVVDKAGEKHEIARSKETKVTGEPKVGDKVTVHYTMSAKDIEVKK